MQFCKVAACSFRFSTLVGSLATRSAHGCGIIVPSGRLINQPTNNPTYFRLESGLFPLLPVGPKWEQTPISSAREAGVLKFDQDQSAQEHLTTLQMVGFSCSSDRGSIPARVVEKSYGDLLAFLLFKTRSASGGMINLFQCARGHLKLKSSLTLNIETYMRVWWWWESVCR